MAGDSAERFPVSVNGDAAWWLAHHGTALRRYLRRRVDSNDVDDLMQEVLLRVQTAAITYEIDNSESYLLTVARNVVIARHRHDRARDGTGFETYVRIVGNEDGFSPERIAIGRDEYERARSAILSLPPRARAAFQFHRFDGLTYQQIAETMGISKESVKDLIHRAMKGIVSKLADSEMNDV